MKEESGGVVYSTASASAEVGGEVVICFVGRKGRIGVCGMREQRGIEAAFVKVRRGRNRRRQRDFQGGNDLKFW